MNHGDGVAALIDGREPLLAGVGLGIRDASCRLASDRHITGAARRLSESGGLVCGHLVE